MQFARLDRRELVADFGGGAITSNAGALLLGATDRRADKAETNPTTILPKWKDHVGDPREKPGLAVRFQHLPPPTARPSANHCFNLSFRVWHVRTGFAAVGT